MMSTSDDCYGRVFGHPQLQGLASDTANRLERLLKDPQRLSGANQTPPGSPAVLVKGMPAGQLPALAAGQCIITLGSLWDCSMKSKALPLRGTLGACCS